MTLKRDKIESSIKYRIAEVTKQIEFKIEKKKFQFTLNTSTSALLIILFSRFNNGTSITSQVKNPKFSQRKTIKKLS